MSPVSGNRDFHPFCLELTLGEGGRQSGEQGGLFSPRPPFLSGEGGGGRGAHSWAHPARVGTEGKVLTLGAEMGIAVLFSD